MGRCGRRRRKRVKRTLPDAERAGVDDLLAWMRVSGDLFENGVFSAQTNGIRGLFCKRRVESGAKLLVIPHALILSQERVLSERDSSSLVHLFPGQINWLQLLAISLLRERGKGASSFWWPYIRSLPSSFDTALTLSDLAAASLPADLRQEVDERKRAFRQEFSALPVALGAHFPWREEEFLWAVQAVQTRCVFVAGQNHALLRPHIHAQCALVPLLDLINHSDQPVCSMQPCPEGVQVVALRTLPRFSQLTFEYGAHDDRALLLEYGFTLGVSNAWNAVPVDPDEFRRCTGLEPAPGPLVIFADSISWPLEMSLTGEEALRSLLVAKVNEHTRCLHTTAHGPDDNVRRLVEAELRILEQALAATGQISILNRIQSQPL